MQYYGQCLRNPIAEIKHFHVGGRIKGYLVWLSQKSLFHVVPTIQHWLREIWYSCIAFNTTFKWIGSMCFMITCSRWC